ncbi:MAG: hypothetical protein HOJ19_00980 [Candidatus Marinimicrobia bacterium]|nr:hypothetical protein [Candidatus Neomarinimicrobiota bacterium]MBT3681214.1 hypothetical protein [Candidatus Neomarinimicrobiota bacterium]MBT3951378.1 hypothetical protein [Candidatus Neomarinimicrobiota bacterium]MBT4480539.1 hypothetical protein [Candidatus Neomarinimicrobiota bacterium]MBT5235450.1 hypothetical protein [Candidatus Neomarinimicrobiota bacterium]
MGRKLSTMNIKKLSGLVTSIVDGNTFVMSVQFQDGQRCTDKYTEKVKIYGLDKPSTSTLSGILAKLELEKMIAGQRVECEILERDESDQIIARLPERYLMARLLFNPDVED